MDRTIPITFLQEPGMKTLGMRFVLGCLALAFSAALVGAGGEPAVKREQDIVYGRKFGSALTFDVFTPPANANGAAVVWVVSGGWFSSHDFISHDQVKEFTKRGYTVFAVVHGSQPKYAIPEVLVDMHRAVRFIRTNAKKYNIDSERIGITGASAGGHLSLMQGTAGKDGDPNAKDPIDRASSRVQAVACFFPPTDFLNWGKPGELVMPHMPEPVKPAFDFREQNPKSGGFVRITDEAKVKTILQQTSPMTHASSKSAPALIIHGDKDTLVPIQQAEILVAKLKDVGVAAELVVKQGAAHGWNPKDMSKDRETMADWFDKHLAKK
jgi:acetyl esterase/lipase